MADLIHDEALIHQYLGASVRVDAALAGTRGGGK